MVHNPGYDFNDDIITTGATLFARLVENTVANLWRRTRMKITVAMAGLNGVDVGAGRRGKGDPLRR